MSMAEMDGTHTDDPDGAAAADQEAGRATPGPTLLGSERLVHEGLEHLQRAARETIAAMRALLDVAEQLVEDPKVAETVVSTIGSLAEAAVRSTPGRGSFGRTAPTRPEDGDDGGGVQRIPVS